jgi:hypothetical protein
MAASQSLLASYVCRFLGLVDLSFLDGVVEAEAAIPLGVSILLFCPCCYDIGSNDMVEQEGCVLQEYAQTVVCAGDRWKMCILCWVCGWQLAGLIFSPDVVVVWGCRFWSSIACLGHVAPV